MWLYYNTIESDGGDSLAQSPGYSEGNVIELISVVALIIVCSLQVCSHGADREHPDLPSRLLPRVEDLL